MDSIVVKTLKERYFRLIKREKIGETPNTTRELDELEVAIRSQYDEAKD